MVQVHPGVPLLTISNKYNTLYYIMKNTINTIKKVWPQACWSISVYENNKHVAYVSNGVLFKAKGFVSGYAEAKDPEDALDVAFREALHKEYELTVQKPEKKKR